MPDNKAAGIFNFVKKINQKNSEEKIKITKGDLSFDSLTTSLGNLYGPFAKS